MSLFVEIEPGVMLNVDSIAFMFRVTAEEHNEPGYEGEDITIINTFGGQLHVSKTPKQINETIAQVVKNIQIKRMFEKPKIQSSLT
jgi:hypothetical protein